MSDTPRTESAEPYGPPYNEAPLIHVPKAFARQLERELWESINGHGSWDADPWVWVIQFRRITP